MYLIDPHRHDPVEELGEQNTSEQHDNLNAQLLPEYCQRKQSFWDHKPNVVVHTLNKMCELCTRRHLPWRERLPRLPDATTCQGKA